jgi:hypothetical protein
VRLGWFTVGSAAAAGTRVAESAWLRYRELPWLFGRWVKGAKEKVFSLTKTQTMSGAESTPEFAGFIWVQTP